MARQLWYLGLPWLLLSPVIQAQAPAAQPPTQEAGYTVKPGDILSISVWKEPDLQRPALVRPDGAFSFPLVGEVDARGKTVAELNKLVKPDDIVFNEGVRNAGACLLQLERPLPNTCVRSGGGGLGWSGGMALGAKLAAPDKMMVQVVGDGGFYFGGPSSVFSVAKQYNLPILVLLLDNTGWSAVKESTLRVFPQGTAKATDKFQASLMPDADFSKIGEAFGAHGEKVTNPDDVPAALRDCQQHERREESY